MRRVRPYYFYLDPEDDAELIAFLERNISNMRRQGIKTRSEVIRALLYRLMRLERAMEGSKSLRRSVARALNNVGD